VIEKDRLDQREGEQREAEEASDQGGASLEFVGHAACEVEAFAGKQRPQEAADEGDGDDDAERNEARLDLERAGRALVGAHADQQREQPKRDDGGHRRALQCAEKIDRGSDGSFGRGRHPTAHTFSISGRPRMPLGRKIMTITSTEKAATSLYSIEK